MSVLTTMEGVQTTATTSLPLTAVPVGNTLTWTQTGGTAPADLGSHRMIPQSLVMVREVARTSVSGADMLCAALVL